MNLNNAQLNKQIRLLTERINQVETPVTQTTVESDQTIQPTPSDNKISFSLKDRIVGFYYTLRNFITGKYIIISEFLVKYRIIKFLYYLRLFFKYYAFFYLVASYLLLISLDLGVIDQFLYLINSVGYIITSLKYKLFNSFDSFFSLSNF